jgi:hypothetical protein
VINLWLHRRTKVRHDAITQVDRFARQFAIRDYVKLRRLQTVKLGGAGLADDKSKDWARVAGGDGYEVEYFARKPGITKDHAERDQADRQRPRKTLDSAAPKFSR